jgi:hypothetical protein
MHSRLSRSALALCAAALLSCVVASSAGAFSASWSCYRAASNHCTDPSGQYHSWIYTDGGSATSPPTVFPTLCVKAVTSAGNVRSTTSGNWCANNTTFVTRCLTSATPTSLGYVYWLGGTGTKSVAAGFSTSSVCTPGP